MYGTQVHNNPLIFYYHNKLKYGASNCCVGARIVQARKVLESMCIIRLN